MIDLLMGRKMKKRISWDFEKVKNFIEVESATGCLLISKTYLNMREKLLFKCKCGVPFETNFNSFKDFNKRQCNDCGKRNRAEKRRLNYNDVKNFIEIKSKSGCKLITDYYSHNEQVLQLICRCGNPFEVAFSNFQQRKRSCNQCSNWKRYDHKTVKEFIEVESKSNCVLLTDRYNRCDEKIMLICECGNPFETTFEKFLHRNKRQCNDCGDKRSADAKIIGDEEFKKRIFDLIGDEYLFMETYTMARERLKVIHTLCGHEFKVSPNNFIDKEQRCPKCNPSISKGEKKIINIFDANSIYYDYESSLLNCKNKNLLSFDFQVKINDILIFALEFDGKQHFQPIEHFGGEYVFKNSVKRDKIKNKYCKKNNIPLIRIPYWEYNNIENILNHVLGYYQLTDKRDVGESLVHTYLVNHESWSHEKYLEQAKQY